MQGNVKAQFFAYASSTRTGINVAAGDLGGDGRAEIAVGPASNAGSQPVSYFSHDATAGGFKLVGQVTFLAKSATGGASIAIADVGSDASGDLVLARTAYGGSVTVVYSGAKPATPFVVPGMKGMSLSALDTSGYGRAVIIAGPTGAGKMRAFDSSGAPVPGVNISVPFSTGANVVGFLSR
jgi:hypothetical protein